MSQEQTAQQDMTIESTFRVLSLGDRGKRMNLLDLRQMDTIWVNTVGYEEDSEIYDVLNNHLSTGNKITARVTNVNDRNEYWDLVSITLLTNEFLSYMPTRDFVVGPADDFWEEQTPEDGTIMAGRSWENKDGYAYELQLQAKRYRDDSGEVRDVFPDLLSGELFVEEYFSGDHCSQIEEAEAVIVVNPQEKDYIASYLFPDRHELFKDIFEEYQEYLENHT